MYKLEWVTLFLFYIKVENMNDRKLRTVGRLKLNIQERHKKESKEKEQKAQDKSDKCRASKNNAQRINKSSKQRQRNKELQATRMENEMQVDIRGYENNLGIFDFGVLC